MQVFFFFFKKSRFSGVRTCRLVPRSVSDDLVCWRDCSLATWAVEHNAIWWRNCLLDRSRCPTPETPTHDDYHDKDDFKSISCREKLLFIWKANLKGVLAPNFFQSDSHENLRTRMQSGAIEPVRDSFLYAAFLCREVRKDDGNMYRSQLTWNGQEKKTEKLEAYTMKRVAAGRSSPNALPLGTLSSRDRARTLMRPKPKNHCQRTGLSISVD